MTRRWNFTFVLALYLLSSPPGKSQDDDSGRPVSLAVLDYDNTVTNDFSADESPYGLDGIYPTEYQLLLLDQVPLLPIDPETGKTIALETLPAEIMIPLQDYRRFKHLLGSIEGLGTSFLPIKLSGGREVYLSHYRLDERYPNFRDRPDHKPMDDEIKNLKAHLRSNPQGVFKGAAFPILELMTYLGRDSRPFIEGVIATARGNSKESIAANINKLLKLKPTKLKGYKRRSLSPDDINPHGTSDFSQDSYFQVLAEKKWRTIENAWNAIQNLELSSNWTRRSAEDPNVRIPSHYFIVPEDDPITFSYIYNKLRSLVDSQTAPHVKVGMMCLASQEDFESIVLARNPIGGISRQFILTPSGSTRPMTKEEVIGEPIQYQESKKQEAFEKKLTKSMELNCSHAFM